MTQVTVHKSKAFTKLSWRARLRWWWRRRRLGELGRAIEDDLARRETHAMLFGGGLPDVHESWNLVCDVNPSAHYSHAGEPADPEAHRGSPCPFPPCQGQLRPRTPEDKLAWVIHR